MSPNVRIRLVAIALAVAGCSSSGNDLSVAPGTGTLYGTISNTSGALAGVTVVVTPVGQSALPAVTTNNAGVYRVTGIDVSLSGSGAVAVSGLPNNCTAPTPASYNGLRASDSINVSVAVTCTTPPSTGNVVGTITSSLGGGIAGAKVTVTPTNASALAAVTTATNGSYAVSSVPAGKGGSVTVASLPSNCTAPSAASYNNLVATKTDTVNVTVTCTPTTGSLSIVVSAPAGVTPSVSVSGPNGYSKTLSASQVLSGLALGNYTVTAATETATNAIVAGVDTATVKGATENVTGGASLTDTVTYTARPGTGALWVANDASAHAFVGYTAAQLGANGTPAPTFASAAASPSSAANAMAFDAHGNLWEIGQGASQILEYGAGQLTSGTPIATITINDPNQMGVSVNGIAFDAQGNLWLANYGPCDIDELSASQLATASGSVTKTPVLTLNGCGSNATVTGPNGLAFDAQGNLWVADVDSSDVYEYPAGALSGTGQVTSEPVFQTRPGIPAQYLAFDGGGNLWVSGGNQVVRLTASELSSGGSTSPVTVTPSLSIRVSDASAGPCAPAITSLEGVAFDDSGDLWIVDNANAAVVELSATQLASGGTTTPAATIATTNGSMTAPWSLAFNPHPTGLPSPVAPGPSLARRRK